MRVLPPSTSLFHLHRPGPHRPRAMRSVVIRNLTLWQGQSPCPAASARFRLNCRAYWSRALFGTVEKCEASRSESDSRFRCDRFSWRGEFRTGFGHDASGSAREVCRSCRAVERVCAKSVHSVGGLAWETCCRARRGETVCVKSVRRTGGFAWEACSRARWEEEAPGRFICGALGIRAIQYRAGSACNGIGASRRNEPAGRYLRGDGCACYGAGWRGGAQRKLAEHPAVARAKSIHQCTATPLRQQTSSMNRRKRSRSRTPRQSRQGQAVPQEYRSPLVRSPSPPQSRRTRLIT